MLVDPFTFGLIGGSAMLAVSGGVCYWILRRAAPNPYPWPRGIKQNGFVTFDTRLPPGLCGRSHPLEPPPEP